DGDVAALDLEAEGEGGTLDVNDVIVSRAEGDATTTGLRARAAAVRGVGARVSVVRGVDALGVSIATPGDADAIAIEVADVQASGGRAVGVQVVAGGARGAARDRAAGVRGR